MTYKYRFVRHDLYENAKMSKLKANSHISNMVRLFKLSSWLILFFLIIAGILTIIFIIIKPNSLLIMIPVALVITISVLIEIMPENYLYNSAERMKELIEKKEIYKKYLDEIHEILNENDINTPNKVKKLKEECESKLNAHESNFSKMNNKVIDMLIGVPLGALVASIIYANSETVVASIIVLIIVGFMVVGVIRLIKFIIYYSEGHFKDVHLLNVLNELDYSEYNVQE